MKFLYFNQCFLIFAVMFQILLVFKDKVGILHNMHSYCLNFFFQCLLFTENIMKQHHTQS